jgi:Putative Ig domain
MKQSSILFNLLGAVGLLGLLSGCDSGGGGTTGGSATASTSPVISSTPTVTGTQGTTYRYDVDATDPDGDTLTYSLVPSPVATGLVEPVPFGMAIDPTSGVISWTPAAQTGDNLVTVQVSDGSLAVTQPFTVTVVAETNTQLEPVFITPTVLPQAIEQIPYTATLIATDANNDPITYSITTQPTGSPQVAMTIDQTTGQITWTPGVGQAGARTVTVQATDPGGLSASQTFTINVNTATAATGVNFGFDVLSRNGFIATLTGNWDTTRVPNVFSTASNSAVIVRGTATVTIDKKGRPRFSFPEFTFQGVDLFNTDKTSPTSFAIVGYRTGDDRLPTFSLTVPVNDIHRLLNSGPDDSGRPMDVKIDELWITGINSSASEFGVGCLGVGTSGNAPTCP